MDQDLPQVTVTHFWNEAKGETIPFPLSQRIPLKPETSNQMAASSSVDQEAGQPPELNCFGVAYTNFGGLQLQSNIHFLPNFRSVPRILPKNVRFLSEMDDFLLHPPKSFCFFSEWQWHHRRALCYWGELVYI